MKKYDLYLGTRLHGAIAALNAGVPALLFCHDSRTLEAAEFCGIPNVRVPTDKRTMNSQDIYSLYQQLDLQALHSVQKENYRTLQEFYRVSGLPTRL